MQIYLDLLNKILTKGETKGDRTGVGVKSLFGEKLEFNLKEGFPLLTTKKIYVKGVIEELLWFLRGETNIKSLQKNNCNIWNEWADENGEIGPLYGKQWRSWNNDRDVFDQISILMQSLKNNPNSRRHIISAWNVAYLPDEKIKPLENVKIGKMALAPCHVLSQFYVSENGLSCQVYLRSQDFFLGTPFNIASYAFLTHMIAQQLDLAVNKLIWIAGDVHLYSNHFEQAKLQLSRTPGSLPNLIFNRKPSDIFTYNFDDFKIDNYQAAPKISAAIAV